MKVKPQGGSFWTQYVYFKILTIKYIGLWNQFSNRFSNLLVSFEISLANIEDNATHGTILQEPTDDLIDSIANDFSLNKDFVKLGCSGFIFGYTLELFLNLSNRTKIVGDIAFFSLILSSSV